MRPLFQSRRLAALSVLVACIAAAPRAQTLRQPFSRVAVTVTPDHPDWTYQPGEAVTFRIDVVRDGHQVAGATVKYGIGPEMLPPVTQATAVVGATPLTIAGGTMNAPGFLRLVATAEVDGRTYRGVGTAGFAPERIQPTQVNPPDFDAFWDGRAHPAGGAAARREVDAAAGLRHRGCGLLADQPAERRPDRGGEPALWHPVHARARPENIRRCSACRAPACGRTAALRRLPAAA